MAAKTIRERIDASQKINMGSIRKSFRSHMRITKFTVTLKMANGLLYS